MALFTNVYAQTGHQFDKKTYTKIAKRNIGRILTHKIDPDIMISDMEKLIDLGIEGCKEHLNEPDTPSIEIKMLNMTIDSKNNITSMTLDQIEEQWHEGSFLKSRGIDIMTLDHFSHAMCHYDSVIHPATAIICLQEYKKTKNEEFLDQMKAELAEVMEHMKHLD
jgi:hypothetical protein